jgi:hypothetical protein
MQVRFAPKATDVLRRRGRQPVGRLAEDPERAVARPLAIALAILGKRDACLRDRRRRQTPLSGLGGLSGGTLSHRSWREGQQQKPRHWATVAGFLRSVHRGSIHPSTTLRHDTQTRHSDEEARNHDHHSGDEESQAGKQQKVAQEYMHTPASPYLPPMLSDYDISSHCPWFDA